MVLALFTYICGVMKTAMGTVRLIILDFDGTLGDTRRNIIKTFRDTMVRLSLPMMSEEACGATIGLPLGEGFEALYPEMDKAGIDECVRVYREIFDENKALLKPKLFPGVKETLSRIHSRGVLLSVASSRGERTLDEFLTEMEIAPMICYVLGANGAPKPKPDPAPVLKTLADLGIPASEALVVGDMPVDILMGARAGVRTCGVTYGNSSREALSEAGADYIIDSFPELLEVSGL